MYATSTGTLELCNTLLDAGAKINQLDVNKDHALNWATYYGYTDIMKLLIKEGADIQLKSKHGTAVDVAFRLWHNDSVALPFKETSIAKKRTKKEHMIINAVSRNDYAATKKLLKKGLSPNIKDELGTPLLQLAIHRNNIQMLDLLISGGADVNALNRVGQSSLAWAARFGSIDNLNTLLKSGADANIIGEKYNLTPLMGAAVNGKASIAAILLEHDADIETRDIVNEASALHWAIWYKNSDVAILLIQNGANYTYKALDNTYSALDAAKLSQMNDVVSFIKGLEQSKNLLLGSWKVQEIHYQYTDTTYVAKDEDHGRFIFSQDNYALMYNPRMQARQAFKNLSKPEPDEITQAFRSVVFNTGTYTIQDSIVTTKADIAKVPGFEGGQQFYSFSLNNDTLEFIMFDESYPNGDKPEWFGKLKVKFILKKE